jgi:ferredoxin
MARPDLRHAGNVEGAWYVDERCIDCGTCRDLAPAVFSDIGPQSVVAAQPDGADGEESAWLAAQACPTQSIGTLDRRARPGRLYRGACSTASTTSGIPRPTASGPPPTW